MSARATERDAHARRPAARSTGGEGSLKRLAWLGMAGLLAVMLAFSHQPAQGEEPVPEPDGYRMETYRAPTPPTLRGAKVLDTPAAQALWRDKAAIFVDVMPRDVKPANLPAGTIWRDKRRDHIPGSVWLANVGYGALTPEMDAWFRKALDEISQGRREAPLIFYCMTDCWMSWNAARRAMSYGYRDVLWYPAGSDGWAKAGLPLEEAAPKP